jgi:hypothetical protein
MNTFDTRPGPESTIGQEIIAGDYRINEAYGLGETARPTATFWAARVVGIPIEDRVVEVEDQVARRSAQSPELPRAQQLALQDHRVELRRAAQLERSGKHSSFHGLTGQGPTGFVERRAEGPDSVSTADVVW